jgi:SAM-dependent methyltransferase
MKKLNLGCGKKIKKGYVNQDIVDLPGVDLVHDLNKFPWPFKKNQFDEVYCDNILEHLDSILKPMEEIWRITKNKSKIEIIVPAFPSIGAAVDPTHKQFFTYLTFDYFSSDKPEMNFYTHARFRIKSRKIIFPNSLRFLTFLINLNEKMQKAYFLTLSFIIPASFLYFELETLK